MKLLTYENTKLKRQLLFSLPAGTDGTCNVDCKGCYAIKAEKIYPNVKSHRFNRLGAADDATFVPKMIEEITKFKKPVDAIRVHVSGDFYSQEYINKWEKIAKALPDKKFYAFTKRLRDFRFTQLKALPNFVIIDSNKYEDLNYDTLPNLLNKAIDGTYCSKNPPFVCPATIKKTVCDNGCGYCWTKQAQKSSVLFVKH